jgi:hypothetical protein
MKTRFQLGTRCSFRLPGWVAICACSFILAGLPAGKSAEADQSPARRSIDQLKKSRTLRLQGDLEASSQAYSMVEKIAGAPAHHYMEAREQILQIEREKAGLPPREPSSSRVTLAPLPQPGVTLHVSPNGLDENPGTSQKPFATVERARDEIRKLKGENSLTTGVVVLIHGGEYQVKETLVLEAADSGTEQYPIVYRAAPGESPRFRGGVRLKKFQPAQNIRSAKNLPAQVKDKVWAIELRNAGLTNLLPLKLGGFASGHGFRTHPAHELFFNGDAMQLARGPNEGFLRVSDVAVKDGTKGYDRQGSKTGQFLYEGSMPERWVNEPDLLLYGYWFWDWADSYERVESIDPERRLITLAQPWHRYGFSIGAPFYAVNALSELDSPGEWYLDRQNGFVYIYPPSDIGSADVELSMLAVPMLRLDNVSHVRFERITWELGSSDAIKLSGGSNCLFAGCTVRRFAGNGIEIQGGQGHGILSSDIYSMGRGGAIVSGGNRKTLAPGRHFVENCDIHNLSRIDRTYTPAVLLSGVGNRLAHNKFHDVQSSAMRIGGNDHVIEFNEIFNAVLESDDQGAADMWGDPTYRGNVYRYNHWHQIGWRGKGDEPKCGQAAIRLDDAICDTLIYGNIFERAATGKIGFGAVQIHGGKDNILDSNLFIDCKTAISFTSWSEERWAAFVQKALENPAIDKALYLERYPKLAQLNENANHNQVYRNITLRCGEMLRRAPKSIETLDNSVIESGDIPPQRPDFPPIPVDAIGLYIDTFRSARN